MSTHASCILSHIYCILTCILFITFTFSENGSSLPFRSNTYILRMLCKHGFKNYMQVSSCTSLKLLLPVATLAEPFKFIIQQNCGGGGYSINSTLFMFVLLWFSVKTCITTKLVGPNLVALKKYTPTLVRWTENTVHSKI